MYAGTTSNLRGLTKKYISKSLDKSIYKWAGACLGTQKPRLMKLQLGFCLCDHPSREKGRWEIKTWLLTCSPESDCIPSS